MARQKWMLVMALIAPLIMPMAAPLPALAQGTVAAAGEGIVEAMADEARVAFRLTGIGPTLRAAVADANARADRIADEVAKLNLPGARVDIDRVTAGDNPDKGVFSRKRDYRVSVGGMAVVTDMDALLPVVYLLSDLDVEGIDQVRLRMGDDAPEVLEATEKAVKDATRKAGAMAKALGKTLGDPVEVRERGIERELVIHRGGFAVAEMAGGPVGTRPGPGAVPNTVTVRVEVAATFKIK